MKVLIAVDGSTGSLEAVKLAGELLSPEKDEIRLYYSPPQRRHQPGEERLTSEIVQRWNHALTDAVFDKVTEQLSVEWAPHVRRIVGTQSPKHGILVAADETRAEMIVVGARGTGPITGLALGSVGRAVVHAATVPVLVVRPSAKRSGPQPLRILFACDGSPTSRYASKTLSDLTWPADCTGRVISVIDSGLVGNVPEWLQDQIRESGPQGEAAGIVTQIDEQRQQALSDAEAWCGELPDVFAREMPLILTGHASKQILSAIESEQTDLIIVGSRGLGPLRRVLVGSTSEHLLSHAPCSILIVRHHEAP